MAPTRIVVACLAAVSLAASNALTSVAQSAPAAPLHASQAVGASTFSEQPFDAVALSRAKALAAKKLAALQSAASQRGEKAPRRVGQAAVVGSLNASGLAASDENGIYTPSDSTGAIGPNNYVEIINSLIAVYDRSLNRVGGSVSLFQFMNIHNRPVPTGSGVGDPQIEWDQQANRWLYAGMDPYPGAAYLFYGWSKTSDPTNLTSGWCQFDWGGTSDWYDAPKLGHDATSMIVGANLFNLPSSGSATLLTASVIQIKKPAAGVTTCSQPTPKVLAGTRSSQLKNEDGTQTMAFAPVPANTTDSGTSTYVVSAHDPTEQPFSPSISIWHVSYDRHGSPQWQGDGAISVPNYQDPPAAPQGSAGTYLSTGDARLTQAVARADPDASNNVAIWTTHTVTPVNTPAEVRWYELIPSTLTARQIGDTFTSIFVSNFNAAISPTIDGNEAVLTYNVSSGSQLASIVVQSRLSSTPLGQMDPVAVPTVGVSPNAENDSTCGVNETQPCDWGDYPAATPDPLNPHTVWVTNAVTGAGTGGTAGWITRNVSVSTRGVPSCATTTIAAGYYHSLAVGSDGTVWAWGADGYGQLGHGAIPNQDTPLQVYGPGGIGTLSGIDAVAAGQYHSVAVKATDGTVWTWGYNLDGELGNNDLSGASQSSPVQVIVYGSGGQTLTGISAITSRNDHTLAIRKSDGSVWAWGLNTYGQLGNRTVSNRYAADQVVGVNGSGFLTGIVAIAVGDNFSLALDGNGNVYAWGDDSAGQLGDNRSGFGVQSSVPIPVHGLNNSATLGGVLSVAARSSGADAIYSDHSVLAWGTGNQPQSLFPVVVAGSGGTGTLFPMVADGASFNTTLTVDPNTGLWDWGDNTYGQLGDGTQTFRPNAVQVLAIGGGPSALTGVVAATGGVGHALALLTSGTVAAWGWNSAGQLGDNSMTNRLTPVQVAMPTAAEPGPC